MRIIARNSSAATIRKPSMSGGKALTSGSSSPRVQSSEGDSPDWTPRNPSLYGVRCGAHFCAFRPSGLDSGQTVTV